MAERRGGVRLWAVGAASASAAGGPDAAARSLNSAALPGGSRFSPVLQDRPQGGARLALPGNVIVTLDPSWSQARIESWADGAGLELLSRLAAPANTWTVRTGPGIEALETANRLRGTHGVVAAYPDWWMDGRLR
jgi:hypothetical protein